MKLGPEAIRPEAEQRKDKKKKKEEWTSGHWASGHIYGTRTVSRIGLITIRKKTRELTWRMSRMGQRPLGLRSYLWNKNSNSYQSYNRVEENAGKKDWFKEEEVKRGPEAIRPESNQRKEKK